MAGLPSAGIELVVLLVQIPERCEVSHWASARGGQYRLVSVEKKINKFAIEQNSELTTL